MAATGGGGRDRGAEMRAFSGLWLKGLMRVGIDASNLRAGGGVTHLVELLRAADPHAHGFEQVIVWGGAAMLSKIEDRDWLCKVHDPLLDRGLPFRGVFEPLKLKKIN